MDAGEHGGSRTPLREAAVAAALGLALAVVVAWPVPARLASGVPEIGFGDPYIQSWQVAWGGHALVSQPFDFFDANVFWPEEDSLAFTDALIGYGPAGLIGSGPVAALVRYNLLFLLAYALPFVGVFLLARELGASRAGAFVAGAAFAYAPFRSDQATHLHVISSGGIPLCLFALARGYRMRRPWWVLGGWLIAAWQISIGFSLGLQLAYLLAILALILCVPAARRRRLPVHASLVLPTVAGVIVFLVYSTWQAVPYLRVAERHPNAVRTEEELELYSPSVAGFLTAPEDNRVWGAVTQDVRETFRAPAEKSLFPGAVIFLLAVTGAVRGRLAKRRRIGLVVGCVVTALFALGVDPWFGDYLYGAVFDHLPGWQGVRTPGRIVTLTSLGLALLAAFGADVVRDGLRERKHLARALPAVLVAAIVLEGTAPTSVTPAAVAPRGAGDVPGPQLHLPSNDIIDRVHTFYSTDGFTDIANGLGAFQPQLLMEMRALTTSFPDASSVEYLRSVGIETVVFHPGLAVGSPQSDVADRPIEGLGVTKEVRDGVVVFDLDP